MKRILERLYDGEVFPNENIRPDCPEYRAATNKVHEEMERWEKKLPKEDYERLEDMHGLICDQNDFELRASFIHGFRLGALISAEILDGNTKLFRNDE